MMSSSGRSMFPFTATQWQELEHQALVFKHMVSGMPVPPDLLFTIRRSIDSSLSSNFLIHQPQHIGWNSFQMGFGRKIDPEPGRCRRTDGKKWRCSKEAYPDSKYCERHMHRGRNRSRKPVEILSPTAATAPTPNAISINSSSITNKNTQHPFLSDQHPHFLYPHFSSPSRPPSGFGLSSQENTTNFFLDSNAHRNNSSSGSGTMRSISGGGSSVNDSSWKLAPLTMGSSLSQIKHNAYSSDMQGGLKVQSLNDRHCYSTCDMPLNIEREDQPKKVMHHFLDEWPPKDKDSWSNSEDKMSSHRTQLSISIPNSLHDFMTQK